METMKKLSKLLKRVWLKYNPFDLGEEFEDISKHISSVYKKVVVIEDAILRDLEQHRRQSSYCSSLVNTMGDNSPDMLWAKDIEGKYIYANTAIKNGLLLDHNPIGKDDITLTLGAKQRYGEENHTFGQMCVNSDLITLRENKECSFWEYGKVKGEDLHLFVKKRPLYLDGILLGTVGSGRDITELIKLHDQADENCPACNSFVGILKKYKYEG